jgi:LysR family transcriptional regulator for bpeEF and oprC
MELESTRIFVKVVQQGSFSKAAMLMRLPKSTVSRTISRMENETGTKLLMRTTRSLTLTPAGRVFYDACLGPVQILEDARRSLQGQDSMLAGLVRLTAPEDLGSQVIAPAIAEITKTNVGISFDLNYTDSVVDLIKDGYDLAIRIGKLNPSSFKAKRLGHVTLVLVAAPDYLKRVNKIREPRDLAVHQCLSYSFQAQNPRWVLRSKKESVTVAIKPRIMSNQMTSLVRMALSGAGVALGPNYLCKNELNDSSLMRVLPDWSNSGFPVSILSPQSTAMSARLKVATEALSVVIEKTLRM